MHYIITLFNLIYPTLLQLQITIKLKTFLSFHTQKKIHFQSSTSKISSIFLTRQGECIRWREEEKSTVRYRKPRGSRVVCKLRLGTRLCFTPRDLSDDSDEETTILEETKAKEREKEREKGESKNTWRTVFFTLLVRGFTSSSSSSRMDRYSAGKSPLCPKVKYLPFPARDSHILARVSYLTHGRLLFLSLSLGEEDSRSLALFSPRNYVVRDSLSTRIFTELFHGRWSVVRKEGKEEHVERYVSVMHCNGFWSVQASECCCIGGVGLVLSFLSFRIVIGDNEFRRVEIPLLSWTC